MLHTGHSRDNKNPKASTSQDDSENHVAIEGGDCTIITDAVVQQGEIHRLMRWKLAGFKVILLFQTAN